MYPQGDEQVDGGCWPVRVEIWVRRTAVLAVLDERQGERVLEGSRAGNARDVVLPGSQLTIRLALGLFLSLGARGKDVLCLSRFVQSRGVSAV